LVSGGGFPTRFWSKPCFGWLFAAPLLAESPASSQATPHAQLTTIHWYHTFRSEGTLPSNSSSTSRPTGLTGQRRLRFVITIASHRSSPPLDLHRHVLVRFMLQPVRFASSRRIDGDIPIKGLPILVVTISTLCPGHWTFGTPPDHLLCIPRTLTHADPAKID